MANQIPLRSIQYQWESLLYQKTLTRKDSYKNRFGTTVLTRDAKGYAEKVHFSVYYPGCLGELFLIGEFNNWGRDKNMKKFSFRRVEDGFLHMTAENIKHKQPYLFLYQHNGHNQVLRDPAATLLDEKGNCVFWDKDDPGTYKVKYEQPDTLHRATKILQTDMPGLVSRWFLCNNKTKNLAESDVDLFTYIRTCGVLEKIKELGFNTIQFLPVSQSIDGDNWKFRYLVAFPFAIQKNWGNPDSFLALIDECHRLGIAIIVDLILGHCPFKDYKVCNIQGEDIGIHTWRAKEGHEIFLDEHTPWGTKRFRFSDPQIRRYLVESALYFATQYKVDGFRIDNVDGILRFGPNGDGDERPHGRLFMRELAQEIYRHNPLLLIHLESHYFFGDNAKLLVAAFSSDPRALGASAYNSSRLTYYFHTEFMPKAVEEISVWHFEHIREEKEWGRSNSTVADFHNHDAAAGLIPKRATGSYAYDALILKNPSLEYHAIGKIKVMEAIISFGCEGRTLDLLQTFLLQEGTFEHDSSIHWELLKKNERSRQVTAYKKEVNMLLEHPAFWPENTLYRKYVNVDEKNKVFVIKREDKTQGTQEEFYILINLSSKEVTSYAIGVQEEGTYKFVFDSDEKRYAGSGLEKREKKITPQQSDKFEFFSKEINISLIAPYQVLVIKHQKKR